MHKIKIIILHLIILLTSIKRLTAQNVGKLPIIGVENTVSTGDPIFDFHYFKPGFLINDSLKYLRLEQEYIIKKLEKLELRSNKNNILILGFKGKSTNVKTSISSEVDLFITIKDSIITNIRENTYGKAKPITSISKEISLTKDWFTTKVTPSYFSPQNIYELIFNGKTNSILNLTYREYFKSSDNSSYLIKDAFSQNIQYDLNEDKVIIYKGIKIEILKATSSYLTYKVLNYN